MTFSAAGPAPTSPTPNPTQNRSSERPGLALVVAGVTIVAASIIVAAVLLVGAQVRFDRLVEDFARAPAGCDTTLEFAASGEYLVFVETVGRLDNLRGGCNVPTVYGRQPDNRPRVQVSVFDPDDGAALALSRVDDREYESGSFRGVAFRRLDVETAGSYVARVQAPDGDEVVLAVGPDPFAAARPMRLGGLIGGALGVMAGIVLIVVGLIRRVTSRPTPSAGGPAVALPAPAGPSAWAPATPASSAPTAPPPPPPPPGAVLAPPRSPLPPPPPPPPTTR